MRDNTLLQLAYELISEKTLLALLCTVIFFTACHHLEKIANRLNINRWLGQFISAILTFWGLALGYSILNFFSIYLYNLRFNEKIPNLGIVNWWAGAAFSLGAASVFVVYNFIIYKVTNRSIGVATKAINEGITVFVLLNVAFFVSNVIGNGSLTVGFQSLAMYISGTVGCSLGVVAYSYSKYSDLYRSTQKELKIVRLQEQLAQSQLAALSSKINPHFLYNSLNSIAGLSTIDGEKTRDMAIALAKLFRYNINKEESNYASVDEEMGMVMIYLEIEKIRFEENLRYHVQVSTEVANALIPKHLLQPLVENAVKHGATAEGVEVNISITEENDTLKIMVADSGKPFDMNFSPGYGIKSLYDKLDLLANGSYEISFLNDPKAVQIKLRKKATS